MKVKKLLPLLSGTVSLYDRQNALYYSGQYNNVPFAYRENKVRYIDAFERDEFYIYTDGFYKKPEVSEHGVYLCEFCESIIEFGDEICAGCGCSFVWDDETPGEE